MLTRLGFLFHTPAWIGVFVYVYKPQPGLIMFAQADFHFITDDLVHSLYRVWVYSIPELELQLNSNSGIGIEIEIGGIENGIGIENPWIGIGIENPNWFFCNCYRSNY